MTLNNKAHSAIIIFARMSSTRLPGKMLKKLAGKSLIEHVITRAKEAKVPHNIYLATSNHPSDAPLVKEVLDLGIEVFTGDLENVALRALQAMEHFGIQAMARVCGDRIFLDAQEIDHALNFILDDYDFATNQSDEQRPLPGMTCEALSYKAYKKYFDLINSNDLKEHLTQVFYRYPEHFKMARFKAFHPSTSKIRPVIDTPDDFNIINKLVEELTQKYGVDFHHHIDTKSVLKLLEQRATYA